MSRPHIEIPPGTRFARLTIVRRVENSGDGKPQYLCVCDCGQGWVAKSQTLRDGRVKSCGCLKRDTAPKANLQHGMSNTATYRSWSSMINRITNPKDKDFHNYGGRGITVCARWRAFDAFFADMGVKPEDRTLDRVDNDSGYEPGNCRWATPLEQRHNQRRCQ